MQLVREGLVELRGQAQPFLDDLCYVSAVGEGRGDGPAAFHGLAEAAHDGRVRRDEAVEAQLPAQDPRQQLAAEGGGQDVGKAQRRVFSMESAGWQMWPTMTDSRPRSMRAL